MMFSSMPTTQWRKAVRRQLARGDLVESLSVTIATAILLLSGSAVFGQSMGKYTWAVEDLAQYSTIDSFSSATLPAPLPSAGSRPLLVLGDTIDLRGLTLRSDPGFPSQLVIVASEIALGSEGYVTLHGESPVTWPPAAAAAAAPVRSPDGGVLVLIAETLHFAASPTADFKLGIPDIETIDIAAGRRADQSPGFDGHVVLSFHKLALDSSLSIALCSQLLQYAGSLARAPGNSSVTTELEREVLLRSLDSNNPLSTYLAALPPGVQSLPDLSVRIQRGCEWEITHPSARLLRRLVKLENSLSRYDLEVAERELNEDDLISVVNDFSLLRGNLPISRILTTWETKQWEHLGALLDDAAARHDATAIDDLVQRFETSPDIQPDSALADGWARARDRVRRGMMAYKPASPGERIVSDLARDTVSIDAGEVGCGFAIARSGLKVWIATASHVVQGHDTVAVTFWSGGAVPRPIGSAQALVLKPASRVDADIAILEASAPAAWSFEQSVDGDSAVLPVRTPLWSVSAAEGIIVPALAVGDISLPAANDGFIQVRGLDSRSGNSGCPVTSGRGLAGMIKGHDATGQITYIVPINQVREAARTSWGVAWDLRGSQTGQN